MVAVRDQTGDEPARKRGFHLALNKPLERARAVHRVIRFPGDVLLRCVGQINRDVALGDPVSTIR